MGLAFITPASGWICYEIGKVVDRQMGTAWIALAALLVGCAAGMYETYREGLRIEGLDSLFPKPPKKGGGKPE